MPKVPTYDNFQTSEAVQPNVQFQAPQGPTPGAIAADQEAKLGQAMSGAGNMLARITVLEQEKADEFRVAEAINKVTQARQRMTFDSTEGFTQLKGSNALEPDESGNGLDYRYGQKLQGEIDSVAKTLGNERQRAAFMQKAGQIKTAFNGDILSHMGRENQVYQVSVVNGMINNGLQSISLAGTDSAKIQQGLDGIVQAVDMNPLGKSPEELKAAKIEALSSAHMIVLTNATEIEESRNLTFAKEYFEKNKDTMTEKDRVKAAKVIQVTTDRVKTQEFGDMVMADGLSEMDALDLARKSFTGKERDDAVAEVKARFADNAIAEANEVRKLGKAAWSQVMKTGRLTASMINTLEEKSPEELRQIRDWQDQKRRQAKAEAEGGSAAKDGEYYKWRRMSMDNPEQFATLDLSKAEPYLSRADYRHLIEVQAGLVKGDARQMENIRVFKSTVQLIDQEIKKAGIDMTPKEGTPQAAEAAAFKDSLMRALDTATKEKGAPLKQEEAKRIGMAMLREGVEQGSGIFGFFQTKRRGYKIATDPTIKPDANFIAANYNDIPEKARTELLKEIYPNGVPRTPYGEVVDKSVREKIERAYTKGLNQGRF